MGSSTSFAAPSFEPGMILPYGGASAPAGWLVCNGAAVSRTTYANLFSVLGTTYGVGDGTTTFNVPDFLGRTVLGAGAGAGLTVRARGDKGGEETHVLTVAELAAHNHSYNSFNTIGATASGGTYAREPGAYTTGNAGADGAHNNMQPFGVANYIIKT